MGVIFFEILKKEKVRKQRICMRAALVSQFFGMIAHVKILKEWDFTTASNQTLNLAGFGHDRAAGAGVTLDTTNGGDFDGRAMAISRF